MAMFIGDGVSGLVWWQVNRAKTAKIRAMLAGEKHYGVEIKANNRSTKNGGNWPRRAKSDSELC
jgi:hypothetical protein